MEVAVDRPVGRGDQTLHAAGTLTLVIAPAPAAGFDRLRWRLDQLIARS